MWAGTETDQLLSSLDSKQSADAPLLSDSDFSERLPVMIEWGRGGDNFTAKNSGGDAYLLPVHHYLENECQVQDVVMLDSGNPPTLVHLLHALGHPISTAQNLLGNHQQHEIYGYPPGLKRKLIGVIITHENRDHIGGFEALLSYAIANQPQDFSDDERSCAEKIMKSTGDGLWKLFKVGNTKALKAELSHLCAEVLKDVKFVVASLGAVTPSEAMHAWFRRDNPEIVECGLGIRNKVHTDFILNVQRTVFVESYGRVAISLPNTLVRVFFCQPVIRQSKGPNDAPMLVQHSPHAGATDIAVVDADNSKVEAADAPELTEMDHKTPPTTTPEDTVEQKQQDPEIPNPIFFPNTPFTPPKSSSKLNTNSYFTSPKLFKSPIKSPYSYSPSPYSSAQPLSPHTGMHAPSSPSMHAHPSSPYALRATSPKFQYTSPNRFSLSPGFPNIYSGRKMRDNDPLNRSSIVTSYFGRYRDEPFHYAFAGDSAEDVASGARKKLPPNATVLRGLANIVGMTDVDLFAPENREERLIFFDSVWKDMNIVDITETVRSHPLGDPNASPKWDMLQLNHHGSIKNVPFYDKPTAVMSIEQLQQQLQALAHGFFATSPGTQTHADPFILQVLRKMIALSPPHPNFPAVTEHCRVVHLGYPSIVGINTEHSDFTALKSTGAMRSHFSLDANAQSSITPRYAATLTPYVELDPHAADVAAEVERLLAGVLTYRRVERSRDAAGDLEQHVSGLKQSESECGNGDTNSTISDAEMSFSHHFVYDVDTFDDRHDMDFVYRLAQLRRFHMLLESMFFAIKVAKPEIEKDIISRISGICKAFERIMADAGDEPAKQDETAIDSLNRHLMSMGPNVEFMKFLHFARMRATAILTKAWVACCNLRSVLQDYLNESILKYLSLEEMKQMMKRLMTCANLTINTSQQLDCQINVDGHFLINKKISLEDEKHIQKLQTLIKLTDAIADQTEKYLVESTSEKTSSSNLGALMSDTVAHINDIALAAGIDYCITLAHVDNPEHDKSATERFVEILRDFWQIIEQFFKTEWNITRPGSDCPYVTRILDHLSVLSRLSVDHALDECIKRWQDDSRAVYTIIKDVCSIIKSLVDPDVPVLDLEADSDSSSTLKNRYIHKLYEIVELFDRKCVVELDYAYQCFWNNEPFTPEESTTPELCVPVPVKIPAVSETYTDLRPDPILQKLRQKFGNDSLITEIFDENLKNEKEVDARLSPWCFPAENSPQSQSIPMPTKYRFIRLTKPRASSDETIALLPIPDVENGASNDNGDVAEPLSDAGDDPISDAAAPVAGIAAPDADEDATPLPTLPAPDFNEE